MNSEEKSNKISKILSDKKAQNISAINLKGKSPIADYFVIATAMSTTHINALAGEVEKKMEEIGVLPLGHEGQMGSAWQLLDYGDVIVHIFSEESRSRYKLENLWSKE